MTDTPSIQAMKRGAGKAERLLKQMANRRRLMILCHLGQREMTVGELGSLIGLSQSALSQHLALLRRNKLVLSDKRGKSVYYRVASAEAEAILAVLYLIFCRP